MIKANSGEGASVGGEDPSVRAEGADVRGGKQAKRTRISRKLHEELVARVLRADRSLSELAGDVGLSLTQLARWMLEPRTIEAFHGLSRLSDARAQMVLSKYRSNAAVHLIRIASDDQASELSRRACVDLLTTNVSTFEQGESGDGARVAGAPPSEPTQREIYEAFTRMAEPIP